MRETPTSDALFARSRKLQPGGVPSPVRAFGAVGGTPRQAAGGPAAVNPVDSMITMFSTNAIVINPVRSVRRDAAAPFPAAFAAIGD